MSQELKFESGEKVAAAAAVTGGCQDGGGGGGDQDVVGPVERRLSPRSIYKMLFPKNENSSTSLKDRCGVCEWSGHFRYFLILSIIKNDFFAFFIKLITYFCSSPI